MSRTRNLASSPFDATLTIATQLTTTQHSSMLRTFPKISIVTPCYNAARYIESTIASITSQQYPNLEYIVIDGGSTDGTVDIIKQYAHLITYWESKPDSGQYYALQRGYDLSTGEVMAWLNADDMLHHGSLFAVAEIFSDLPNVRWIMGQPTVFNQHGSCVQIVSLNDAIWHRIRILEDQEQFIQQESSFWRRSLWEQAGSYIDTSQVLAGDFELWSRFFRYANLHTATIILGGFRFSSHKQRSVCKYPEYLKEVSAVRAREFQRMPALKRRYTRLRNKLAAWTRPFAINQTFLLRNLYYAVYGPAPAIISFDFANWKYRVVTRRFSMEEQGKVARSTLMDKEETIATLNQGLQQTDPKLL